MLNIIKKIGKFSAICKCERCNTEYSVKNFYDARKSPIGHLCENCKRAISSLQNITQENLLKVFNYDEHTGVVTHKNTTVSGMQGDIATHEHYRGYLKISIGRKSYLAHRIIYIMMTGNLPKHIDHINHNKQDNRWINLRSIAQAENNKNMPKQYNNTTGIVGVTFHKATGKYRACISVNSINKHLGLFSSISAAKKAREEASLKYGYHQNHGK